jgi:hypothetical protein
MERMAIKRWSAEITNQARKVEQFKQQEIIAILKVKTAVRHLPTLLL